MKTLVTVLEEQRGVLETKRGEIYLREEQAIADTILPFFNQFQPEVHIEVNRGSVYFKMDHPDTNYKKELFSIYLRENWDFETKGKKFKGIDLSYYTTSTKGVDKWELRRLQLLGAVAEIILEQQERIIARVNHTSSLFVEEFNEVFTELQELGSRLGEARVIENNLLLAEIKKQLMSSEGITFAKQVNVKFKFNYEARITSLRLINVSKSGKTADAIYTYAGEHLGRAENISVDKIVQNIFHIQKYMAS